MLISKAFYRYLPIFLNLFKCPLRGLFLTHIFQGVCSPNPCLNNGTCVDLVSTSGLVTYACLCSIYYYGAECQLSKFGRGDFQIILFEIVVKI
jgi:hypothetical protein